MQYIKITLKKNLLQLKHTHKTHSSPPPNQNPLPPLPPNPQPPPIGRNQPTTSSK